MAKTDWQMGDTVLPDDLNQIGQEINQNRDNLAAHANLTTGVHGATSAATANTIVQRDGNGRFKAAAPAASDDVARKAEVDATISGKEIPGNDANNAIKTGYYHFNPSTVNGPGFQYGIIQTMVSHGDTHNGTTNWVVQVAYTTGYNAIKMRRKINDGPWSDWAWVWTSESDGPGSGLDADLLDGMQPSTSATANTIVQRDAQGRIKAAAPVAVDDVARKDTVDNAIAALRGAAPGTLDTLAKLAQAINNDPNFAATINAALAGKLDKTGGTMTGPLEIRSTQSRVKLFDIDSNNSIWLLHDNNCFYVQLRDASDNWVRDVMKLSDDGTSQLFGANKIWHAGNDGAGSGLDADTIDGVHLSDIRGGQPLPGNDANNALTAGTYSFDPSTVNGPGFAYGAIKVIVNLGDTHNGSTNWVWQIAYSTGYNAIKMRRKINADPWSKWTMVWTADSDGAGSGLDADLLDGLHASSFWTKSEIPYETGSWTPELRFSGSTAGIAYASRLGRYTRIANVVYWSFEIVLSSKGSASGAAWITGLPFNKEAGLEFDHSVGRASNIALPSGQWLVSYISFATIYLNTNTGSYISDAAFANNSSLRASGFYFI